MTFAERIARLRYILGFVAVWALSLWAMIVAGRGAWYGGTFALVIVVPIWCLVLVTALAVFAILRRAVKKERRVH